MLLLHHIDAKNESSVEGDVKAITLRNLPPELESKIRERAREKGISINKAVIGLLKEQSGLGQKGKNKRHHDLDHLFGAWTQKQAEEFDRTLAEQREIDPELWG
jgi:hypothetical protein